MEKEKIDKTIELLKISKDFPAFIFDDLIIKGCKVSIIKKYIKENPSSKFRN